MSMEESRVAAASERVVGYCALPIRARRGSKVPVNAGIAVVAMGVNGDRRLVEAVNSLLEQDVVTEVIVVNTGSPSVRPLFEEDVLERVVLVEADDVRMPGGARNLGIAQARAPVVAFLAADCLAPPDWARLRIDAHGRGKAVASALRPAPSEDGTIPLSGWASHALLHVRRAPEYPPEAAARYGASYDRDLFARHGLFREDLRIGEDSEFNARIAADAPIMLAPGIVTLHRYPRTVTAAMRDMFERGAHLHAYHSMQEGNALATTMRRVIGEWLGAQRLRRFTTGSTRTALLRATPLMALLALCHAAGGFAAALGLRGRIGA